MRCMDKCRIFRLTSQKAGVKWVESAKNEEKVSETG